VVVVGDDAPEQGTLATKDNIVESMHSCCMSSHGAIRRCDLERHFLAQHPDTGLISLACPLGPRFHGDISVQRLCVSRVVINTFHATPDAMVLLPAWM